MKIRWYMLLLGLPVAVGLCMLGLQGRAARRYAGVLEQPTSHDALALIQPDYNDLTIPPNIAPLNVKILNPGRRYVMKVHGAQGQAILLTNRHGSMRIPLKPWRKLLARNAGARLFYDIAVQQEDGHWQRLKTVSNRIAQEPIDSHLAYRLIKPLYSTFHDMGIYQRELASFKESLILHNRDFQRGCVNCHAFLDHDPKRMLLGIRSKPYGVSCLHVEDGDISKIATKFGHTSWHPSGQLVAYSIYDVRLLLHAVRQTTQDVIEFDSMLAYYRLGQDAAQSAIPLRDRSRLETQPSWDPQGKFLYFASAPKLWTDMKKFPPARYAEVRYDIQRIAYDVATDTWGDIETVVPSTRLNQSCIFPSVSPDGRFLMFCACAYGCFGLYQPSTDLFAMDLETGDIQRLACNSDFSESWHVWSSNSRWIVFSSKRPTGQFTRLYLCYIDENGRARKPFVLPQRDPEFYDSALHCYNVPEMITGPVRIPKRQLLAAIRSSQAHAVDGVTQPSPQMEAEAGQDSLDSERMRRE